MKTGQIYYLLAHAVQARINCQKSNNKEWEEKHEETAINLVKNYMPSGSGIDSGTSIDLDASAGEKLVFNFGFHHMNEDGMYDGWTHHTLTVRPSLLFGIDLKISGPNRNDIKEYLYQVFHSHLTTVCDWSDSLERYTARSQTVAVS